jgi:hypothetical protein
MWHKFADLWNKSIYFRGAVAVFVVGLILALQPGSPATK